MLVSILLTTTLAAALGYDDAMAESHTLEAAGRCLDAAETLEPLNEEYGQDYALFLRLGWLYFCGEDYAEAKAAYARALSLSGGAVDAQLGLAWTNVRIGQHDEAARHFEAVLEANVGHTSAIEGLALTRGPPLSLHFSLAGTAHVHTDHVELDTGGAGTLTAQLNANQWRLGGAYRFTGVRGDGRGQGAHAPVDYIQHEAYAWGGYDRSIYGVTAHYALLQDTSDTFGTVHAMGATARVSWVGDIFLEGNVSLYPDLTIFRVAPSWRVQPFGILFLQPGAAVQAIDGEVLGSANLTVGIDADVGALWAGGKLGREVRPTNFGILEMYDSLPDVRYGAWAGGRIRVADRFYLFGSWAMNALRTGDDDGASDSLHHVFSVGVSRW